MIWKANHVRLVVVNLSFFFLLNVELMYQQIPFTVCWHLLIVRLSSFKVVKVQISLFYQLTQMFTKRISLERAHRTENSGASFISISPS